MTTMCSFARNLCTGRDAIHEPGKEASPIAGSKGRNLQFALTVASGNRCAGHPRVDGKHPLNLQHWRAFQSLFGWRGAPLLEFAVRARNHKLNSHSQAVARN
jgi:hypothetical protein